VNLAVPALPVASRRGAIKLAPALLALLVLVLVAPLAILTQQQASQDFPSGGLPAGAQPFVVIYQDAARAFHVNPFLLMAVHEDETNYSTAQLAGVTDGVNRAGCCAGPMQFSITSRTSNMQGGSGGTWAGFADSYNKAQLRRPARYPGRFTAHTPNVYDSYDAIYAAAAYFHSLGAGPHLDQHTLDALAAYKGTPPVSLPYARHDYQRAQQLSKLAAAATDLLGADQLGDVDGSPLQKVIAYANKIEALAVPYCWGGGHRARVGPSPGISYCHAVDHRQLPDTHTPGLDCSGSVRWLLTLAGFPDHGPMVSGTFASAYPSGPGHHVTIWSNADHVFMTIDGRGWGTSQTNFRNGPAWAEHTTTGFTASHPPGL
jgi:cell wall-associated NlpC family hydrolase